MSITDLNHFCRPSQIYLFLATISLFVMIYYNYDALDFTFCIGEYKCFNTPSKWLLLFTNFLYVLAWTIIIEFVCRTEYKQFAWFLVLAPILLFIMFLVFIFGPWRHKKDIFQFMDYFKLTRNVNNNSDEENKSKNKH